jgi:hypothetical protein
MRYSASRASSVGASRTVRRALALAGVVGLIVVQSMAPATALILPTAAHPAAASAVKPSAVTVPGPKMYNPVTGVPFTNPSSVTVSQTTDLVNQMIHVSWSNFTPSHGPAGYNPSATEYPVMVAECAGDSPGTDPADLAKCYVGQDGLTQTNRAFGPTTEAYTTTASDGTGSVNVQIQTSVQNQGLNCDVSHDCSLLVFPAQGGFPGFPGGRPAADCSNHKTDRTYATAANTFNVPATPGSGGSGEDVCSWPFRVVIPLHFAETPANCNFSQGDFSVVGSPFMERAMTSWASSLCHGSSPVNVFYDGSISEPQARSLFLAGGDDVALTTEPASGTGVHPFTYAPVGISASAVTYWVDNPKTGLPYQSGVELDPRLMAKEFTQSYGYSTNCTKQTVINPPPYPPGCDPSVMNDPQDLLTDPEFTSLNPGLKAGGGTGTPRMVPTVEGDQSDMTWEMTRWIAASTGATQFLAGQPDPWGEHVNTFYIGTQYPTQSFQTKDPDGAAFFAFKPPLTPGLPTSYQVQNWWPGLDWTSPVLDSSGKVIPGDYHAEAVQPVGRRSLLAVMDNADATAFLFPTAALENHAGKYVLPTQASMAAAVGDMTTNPDGITRDANEAATNPAAYPLTMVSYAMVPTGGISHQKAVKIAQWLDFVAGRGQTAGAIPGQLPPGFMPLTASMRAQTLKAAFEVLHQTGDHHHGGSPGGSTGPGGGSSSPSGTSTNGPGAGKNQPTGKIPASKINAAYSNPDSNTAAKLVLPLLLALGALLALAGPSAVVFSRPGPRAAVIGAWRRVQAFSSGRKSS